MPAGLCDISRAVGLDARVSLWFPTGKLVFMEIRVVDHPLVSSRLTIMRDKRSTNDIFRAALSDLGMMLVCTKPAEIFQWIPSPYLPR